MCESPVHNDRRSTRRNSQSITVVLSWLNRDEPVYYVERALSRRRTQRIEGPKEENASDNSVNYYGYHDNRDYEDCIGFRGSWLVRSLSLRSCPGRRILLCHNGRAARRAESRIRAIGLPQLGQNLVGALISYCPQQRP